MNQKTSEIVKVTELVYVDQLGELASKFFKVAFGQVTKKISISLGIDAPSL